MNYKLRIKKERAFTLIELIVVITIIIVLSSVVSLSFVSINMKSRDSKRIADLEKIRQALEMARQVGSTYPNDLDALVPKFLSIEPMDPYFKSPYKFESSLYIYTLSATMEDLGSTNGDYDGYNYQVTNP